MVGTPYPATLSELNMHLIPAASIFRTIVRRALGIQRSNPKDKIQSQTLFLTYTSPVLFRQKMPLSEKLSCHGLSSSSQNPVPLWTALRVVTHHVGSTGLATHGHSSYPPCPLQTQQLLRVKDFATSSSSGTKKLLSHLWLKPN